MSGDSTALRAFMESKSLHDAIRVAADTANFEPLFGYFADDIELRISIALQPPATEQRRGRLAVIRHLQRRYGVDSPASEESVDLFGSDGRIVACRSVSVAVAGGLTVRNDCALVFDIGDGMVRHLAIHHEFSGKGRAVPVSVRDPRGAARSLERAPGTPFP
jgi:hypothetical protein